MTDYNAGDILTYSAGGERHAGGVLLVRVHHAKLDGQVTTRVGDDRVRELVVLLTSEAHHVLEIRGNYWTYNKKICEYMIDSPVSIIY